MPRLRLYLVIKAEEVAAFAGGAYAAYVGRKSSVILQPSKAVPKLFKASINHNSVSNGFLKKLLTN